MNRKFTGETQASNRHVKRCSLLVGKQGGEMKAGTSYPHFSDWQIIEIYRSRVSLRVWGSRLLVPSVRGLKWYHYFGGQLGSVWRC